MSHPPVANKVVAVDFDGTIVPWGQTLMGEREVSPGVVAAMRRLKEYGYRIVIFTSRLSRTWAWDELLRRKGETTSVMVDDWLAEQYCWVAEVLDKAGVPYDLITAEKVPAEAYFDDKAFEVHMVKRPLEAAVWYFLAKNHG